LRLASFVPGIFQRHEVLQAVDEQTGGNPKVRVADNSSS